jgi:hypothetical protein
VAMREGEVSLLIINTMVKHSLSDAHPNFRCRLRPSDVIRVTATGSQVSFIMLLPRCVRPAYLAFTLAPCPRPMEETLPRREQDLDFRRGKRLGPNDRLVEWKKPPQRPPGWSQEQFDALPETLRLRLVRYHIEIPGCSTQEVILVTTLLDVSCPLSINRR